MALIDRFSVSYSDSESDDSSFDSGYYPSQQHCLFRLQPRPVQSAVDDVIQHHLSRSERRLVKWSLPPPPARAASLPGWNPMPFGLETFWQSAFAWFFRPFWTVHNHLWTMEPTELAPSSTEWPWHATTYSAKIHFLCPLSHGWTSKKGRVVFWYRIRRQGDEIICQVLFKLYGQQCIRCMQQTLSQELEFIAPLWYPEEIENAIRSLSVAVIDSYYGGCSPVDRKPIKRIRVDKSHRPSLAQYHDSTRCQACHDGLCVASGFFA